MSWYSRPFQATEQEKSVMTLCVFWKTIKDARSLRLNRQEYK